MEVTASGIDALAAGGAPAFRRLVESEVPDSIRRDRAWVGARAGELDAAIRL
jgi:hypothetical protein